MSIPWIKIETTTPDKPEVSIIAQSTRLDPDAVVGKLLRIWCWADSNSIDGEAIQVTDSFIDRMARHKGFTTAMRSAGWVTGESGNITFPGFSRHNGATAKARASTTKRVSRSRTRNASSVTEPLLETDDCNGHTVTSPLPDKSTDKKNATHSPLLIPSVSETAQTIVSLYPRREKVAEALREVHRQLTSAPDRASMAAEMITKTKAFAEEIRRMPSGAGNTFVPSALTFFAEKRYLDDPTTICRRGNRDGAVLPKPDPATTSGRKPAQVINLDPSRQ